MTIKEYLATKNKTSESFNGDSLNSLIAQIKEEVPTKEELIEMTEFVMKEAGDIYTKGFEDCILELEKIDANFMSRKKQPHLK
jgi:mannitol/fructose-specific phosphotransferase system IIA component (Ntr-type)